MARNERQSGDRRGGLIGSVPGGVGRRGGRPARGGTVLIMVVALLTVLFVAGAAFLSTVSFQSRSITSVQEAQEESRVIQALSTEVREALRKNFVGNDGIPWNQELLTDADTNGTPESPSAIGSDICGELPGINPLLASIDPYDDGSWVFYSTTDLERTLEGKTAAFDAANFPRVVANTVLAAGEVDERGSFYDDATPANSVYCRRDADGDGVWDSNEYLLSEDRFAPAIRGSMGQQLSADATSDGLYYALRILSNGGMANLNHSHAEIIKAVLDAGEVAKVAPPYAPESEEATLRGRFLLPPYKLPVSALQARDGQLSSTLYLPFVPSDTITNFVDGTEDARWWPVDTGENGDDVSEVNASSNGWVVWTDPSKNKYDFRHLLTTVSYDDQLMRVGRSSQYPATEDWITDIQTVNPDPTIDAGTDGIVPDNFFVDTWPFGDTSSNPANGRVKVSLPGLVQNILIAEERTWLEDHSYTGKEIDALSDPGFNADVAARFVGTIQDAFMLMLRNVTAATDLPDATARAWQAAQLTANLIDYADTNDTPTWVGVVDEKGNALGNNEVVYGLERQPYITELYSYVKCGTSAEFSFAVELYNPYNKAIDLAGYTLADAKTGAFRPCSSGTDVQRLNAGLSGTIDAKSFVTFYASEHNPPDGVAGGADPVRALGGVGFGAGNWGVRFDSVIQLKRTVPGPAGNVQIVVDEFDVSQADEDADQLGEPGEGSGWGATEDPQKVSVERDTTTSGVGVSNWRFVVPQASGSTGGHSLSTNPSTYVDASIRPVQIDFADASTSGITRIFPTTGTLLLLCRYANIDPNATTVTPRPFTAALAANYTKVDNGHLPIFDDGTGNNWADATAGPFNLNIPWGQLIFEYFTALPLSNKYEYEDPATFDIDNPATFQPTVDQGGIRVHGRVDINAAPWKLLRGLPMLPREAFVHLPGDGSAGTIEKKIFDAANLSLSVGEATPIGASLAQTIVAYREARDVTTNGGADYTSDFDFSDGGARFRQGTGFLTVGELANVRASATSPAASRPIMYDIDAGALSTLDPADDDFVKVAAKLITLGDWVTTRSHVFTIYGTIRGSGTKSAVDRKALRFQETLDRMPSMFGGPLPQRIGQPVVGAYSDARSN